MLEDLTLTIMTPVYNGEKYIEETIESVINAKINIKYEYIVLDDGSTDSTPNLLNNYAQSIKILTHKNIGESATVNRGLKNALGKFVLILNADDPMLSPELVNSGCKILIENPSISALFPDWKIIDQFGTTLKINILPEYSDELLIGRSKCLPGPGTIFDRNLALAIGGRGAKWKYVGDYDFWLRFSRVGKIERLPKVLAQWRENETSTSISNRGLEMAIERIKVIEDFLAANEVQTQLARKALGNCYYLAARLAFFDPKINGKDLIFKSFKFRRGWPEEAKLHIVIYLVLLPLSRKILNKFPRFITKIVQR